MDVWLMDCKISFKEIVKKQLNIKKWRGARKSVRKAENDGRKKKGGGEEI